MNIEELERLHYRILLSVINEPKKNCGYFCKKLGISEDTFFDTLEFFVAEGYVRNVTFAKGGMGNKICIAWYETIALTQHGMEYMSRSEKKFTTEAENTSETNNVLSSIFVSYNRKSGGAFVDSLEQALVGKATLIRDKNEVGTWESFSKFMDTIRERDFAVLVITDEYLKSSACLYEVIQLMKDPNWPDKAMYIVMPGTHIFSPTDRAVYSEFWAKECNDLEQKIKSLAVASSSELCEELKKYELIRNEVGAFLKIVADSNNPEIFNAIPSIIERVNHAHISPLTPQENNTLSKDKWLLLQEACVGDGVIIASQTLSSYSISTSGKCITESAENRDIAHWKSILDKLEKRRFVSHEGKGIYKVTEDGYVEFDRLKNQQ